MIFWGEFLIYCQWICLALYYSFIVILRLALVSFIVLKWPFLSLPSHFHTLYSLCCCFSVLLCSKQEECTTASIAPVPTTEIPTTMSTMAAAEAAAAVVAAAAAAANANTSTTPTNTVGSVPVAPEPEVTSIVATVVDNENSVTISNEEQAQIANTTAVQDLSGDMSSNAGEEPSKQETVTE